LISDSSLRFASALQSSAFPASSCCVRSIKNKNKMKKKNKWEKKTNELFWRTRTYMGPTLSFFFFWNLNPPFISRGCHFILFYFFYNTPSVPSYKKQFKKITHTKETHLNSSFHLILL
jgi:hypothetical protein